MRDEKKGRTDNGTAIQRGDESCAYIDDTARHEANVREVRYMVKTTARDAYSRLCDFARRRAEAQRPFGVQEWAEAERRQPRVDGVGNDFRVNNTHLPIYARILASDLPEVRPYIELRTSAYDEFFPDLGRVNRGTAQEAAS